MYIFHKVIMYVKYRYMCFEVYLIYRNQNKRGNNDIDISVTRSLYVTTNKSIAYVYIMYSSCIA